MPSQADLFKHTPIDENERATIWIDTSVRSPYTVSPHLLGKFCEHLGFNIYHGMEAQNLFNPTFGKWPFTASGPDVSRPDGGVAYEPDRARIALQAHRYSERMGLHGAALLLRDLEDGCAFGWVRLGGAQDVRTSPDFGPHGDRAQRIEILGDASHTPFGIAQRSYLPLHRTRGFEFRLVARAYRPVVVTLAIARIEPDGQTGPTLVSTDIELDTRWQTATGRLCIPNGIGAYPEGTFEISLTAGSGANVVIDRLLLYPDDHVNHADPDVIRLLREAQLPLLRWPGGNFVSGYHWRDGVGAVDARPTLPNPAWPGLEPNLFGTDEFIAFCREVGCEPMICVNAGLGSPKEAAAWVEYCNGAPDTTMGRLRAENGHPEPYNVRIWEIGNEVHGDWQVGWTTAGGYVDRYRCFVDAMRQVDPAIHILACGGTPIKVKVACDAFSTNQSFGTIPAHSSVPVLDAMAILGEDRSQLIVSLLNRSVTDGPIDVAVDLGDVAVRFDAHLVVLAGETMYDQNTEEEPERIVPRESTVPVQDGQVSLSLAPYSIARLTFELEPA